MTQAPDAPEGGHTPGPWLRIDKAEYAEIQAAFRPSSQAVALVAKPADADLIAAAPELLAELQFAVKLLAPLMGETAQVQSMRAAIARATGAALPPPPPPKAPGESA
ncbi:hypothetical protein [Novosphingobium aromaticivorans]|nr:hypothetical protein [Novosphingobium aromaticivorans]